MVMIGFWTLFSDNQYPKVHAHCINTYCLSFHVTLLISVKIFYTDQYRENNYISKVINYIWKD